jgi:hypothetical protein
MNAICKPHIVDLLRIFDKRRMVTPRIRYASVRSKPELIADLARHFATHKVKDSIVFQPITSYLQVPKIVYHLKEKRYTFDEKPVDVPRESRAQIKFHVRKGPIVISFDEFFPPKKDPQTQLDPPATEKETGASPEFREPDTDTPSDCSEQSEQWSDSGSIPTIVFENRPSSDS